MKTEFEKYRDLIDEYVARVAVEEEASAHYAWIIQDWVSRLIGTRNRHCADASTEEQLSVAKRQIVHLEEQLAELQKQYDLKSIQADNNLGAYRGLQIKLQQWLQGCVPCDLADRVRELIS